MRNEKVKKLAILSMFVAIILLFAFTPIGFIRLPLINATLLHIPVIIGSILLGPKYGAVLGFLFGLTSMINNTMTPNPIISFVFSPFVPVIGTDSGSILALVVCFIPRILVGITPYYVYTALTRLFKDKAKIVSLSIAGVVGSMTNTLLVMHLIFFLFRDSFAYPRELASDAVYGAILGIIATNGIPEAIAAAIVTAAICIPVGLVQKS